MLRRLTIRDFVLVDRLELEFSTGFGVLTGETGAGKSILVDALAFVLGERADAGLVRNGSERAEVGASFELDDAPAAVEWLRAQDLDAEDELVLRRVLDAGGRSRAYINGAPATVQQLREVAETLVDIHGQHAHQSLLRPEAQRLLLDTHAGLTGQARTVGEAWRVWKSAENILGEAEGGAEALTAERERLEWQARELDSLAFAAEEWDALNAEHKRLGHAAGLAEGARFALDTLSEDEAACAGLLDGVVRRLDDLAEYDHALVEIGSVLRSAQAELADAVSALRRYSDRVELDPERLGEVERRLDAVLGCARKYRSTPEALPGLLAGWQERLAALGEQADLAALRRKCDAAHAHYQKLAGELSQQRRVAAQALSGEVSRVMQQLALAGGGFEVALVSLDGGSVHGLEQVDFRISGAGNGPARALVKVASGGELSRISLAIQVVTSQAASVPTLIFDEVDVGIGGGVAEVVGRLLHELGRERQILCVTHLPQVAARADWQWRVSKGIEEGGLRSRVTPLEADDRVEELARMLGGVEITAITRQHAREMLNPV